VAKETFENLYKVVSINNWKEYFSCSAAAADKVRDDLTIGADVGSERSTARSEQRNVDTRLCHLCLRYGDMSGKEVSQT